MEHNSIRVDWNSDHDAHSSVNRNKPELWNPYSVKLPPMIDTTVGALLSHLEFSKLAINAHLDGEPLHAKIQYGRMGKRNVMYLVTQKYIYADAYGKMHRRKREDYERANQGSNQEVGRECGRADGQDASNQRDDA
jgi:hypothetical protein